jgi:hypothetical protein
MRTKTVASVFIAHTFEDPSHGQLAATVMTALILFVTAASLFALILGYSRIPFAAARDGQFFRVFAKVHPTGHFPHVSLLVMGGLALPFCFFFIGTPGQLADAGANHRPIHLAMCRGHSAASLPQRHSPTFSHVAVSCACAVGACDVGLRVCDLARGGHGVCGRISVGGHLRLLRVCIAQRPLLG